MKGRITEEQLPLAEACCPGITKVYRTMRRKPETFLDLLWIYEGLRHNDADDLAEGTAEGPVLGDDPMADRRAG